MQFLQYFMHGYAIGSGKFGQTICGIGPTGFSTAGTWGGGFIVLVNSTLYQNRKGEMRRLKDFLRKYNRLTRGCLLFLYTVFIMVLWYAINKYYR